MEDKKYKFIKEICYSNLPENYHDELKNLESELGFLERSIGKAINSMKVDEYGHEWKEDKTYAYRLYPLQKIAIPIYKARIKIYTRYEEKKPLVNSDWYTLDFELIKKSSDNKWFVVDLNSQIKEDEKIHFGGDEVKWEWVQKEMEINEKTKFKDAYGSSVTPFLVKREKNKYIIFFDRKNEFKGKELYADMSRVDFEILEAEYDFNHLWVYSEKEIRKTSFRIDLKRKSTKKIESTIKIKSRYVIDENGNIFEFSLIPTEKKEDYGVWIVLEEDEEKESIEGRTKRDLFLELLRASSDFEVWESPKIDYRKKENRIRVLRMDTEEGRLLLERKPATKKIYPPKNTYQLTMQKNAVATLLHRPSPEHMPLLKIFMNRENISFKPPSRNRKKINWVFLKDAKREGTDEQRDFVKKSLNTPDFTLLEGPPGSGKTTAITELIYQLLMDGKRVMLVASTHVAVDNVLEKLHEEFNKDPMRYGIVPLRIGREEAISEVIKEYQIEKRREKFLKIFEKEDFFKKSSEDEKTKYLENVVVHTSNLVCGTTIGILQYPPFKDNKGKYFEPEFECLIIDEASKTTFQEFLVPAVNAKKWIIVGDVKQLSPYTDTLQIRLLIDDALRDHNMKIALTVIFNMMFNTQGIKKDGSYYPPPKFIYVARKEVIEKIAEIIKEKDAEINKRNMEKKRPPVLYAFVVPDDTYHKIKESDLFSPQEMKDKVLSENNIKMGAYALPKLLQKDLIFTEETLFHRYHANFPWTHILIWHDNESNNHPHNFRHLYWYRKIQEIDGKEPYAMRSRSSKQGAETEYHAIQDAVKEAFSRDWANELAWRLKRIQELEYEKSDEGSKKYYRASVFALMPPKPKYREAYSPYKIIRKVVGLWMPSILKALQEGISSDWDTKELKTSFSHGLPEDVNEERFSALTYQHRMHPNISYIPRELFYDNKALKDDKFVTGPGRQWGYNEYNRRVVWVDVSHYLKGANVYKNVNRAEGKAIIEELEKFMEWASKQKEKYTAIVLSFYEGQRKYIRDLLRDKYPENRNKQTRFWIKGVDVRVYTVDRVQGKEGDIVFLSMTQNKRIGFMDSPNRINVALTRAKYQLVVVGDIEFFAKQNRSPSLKKFANMLKEKGVIMNEKRN